MNNQPLCLLKKRVKMEYASGSANFSVDQDRCIVSKFADKAVEEDFYIVCRCFSYFYRWLGRVRM